MLKGIYFSQVKTGEVSQGAVMKVFDEIKAFERAGYEMLHINAEPVSKGFRKTHIGKGICAAIPFTYIFSKYKYDKAFTGYDFYYFRFEAADYWFVRFLRQLKKCNPKAKILIEFPDYPNTPWMRRPLYMPLLLKDIVARKKYRKYVDCFVVLNPIFQRIYGVPVVHYMNAIDLSRIPPRAPQNTDVKQVNAIGIGTMFPVHGFERFIKSMASYYIKGGERDIVFHIVGKGPGSELQHYMDVTEKLHMSEHVVFEGQLTGDALASCFNRCNLAIEQLALYRRGGLELSSSLKSREYLARGIPVISGCDIDILLGKDFKYWLRFENNDSPIDMERVLEFFDTVYDNQTEEAVIANIRQFAEKYCTYDATLSEVFRYIDSE